MVRSYPLKKIILIVWVVFSVLYIAYNEWNRFQLLIVERSYNQGFQDALAKVINQAKDCKSFSVNVGSTTSNLVNVECLTPTPTETPKANP